MKKELDEQLCREFPHLYGDRSKSMRETCMYWGFSCNDGWFKPIYELSAKLESMIVKFIEENKEELRCRYCSRKENEHTKFYTFTKDGNKTISLGSEEGLAKEDLFSCDKFDASYPRASQVKEKFGGLRFYMMTSTDEMEKAISEAEAICDITCEDCGKVGESCVDHGWWRTLCPDCVEEYAKPDEFGRVRKYVQYSKLKEKDDNGNKEESNEESSNQEKESTKEG